MLPVVLCILDGCGIRNEMHGNAFKLANKPCFDYLWNNYPHSLLNACGTCVGLPKGQMGNSEVGHTTIGAGRVIYQPLEVINKSIEDRSFYKNDKILELFDHVKNNDSTLHIIALLSDGGVHSHIKHLIETLKLCKKANITKVNIHLITDGRDTSAKSALKYIEALETTIDMLKLGKIIDICGRFYAMDRDKRFNRTKKAYDAIVIGKAPLFKSVKEAIKYNYNNNITDEFLLPSIIEKNGYINDNDGVFVVNFRPDRLVQLCSCITNKKYNLFERVVRKNVKLVSMMKISDDVIGTYAFEKEKVINTLGDYLSSNNLTQLRIAETEKYAHVTYFFDGGEDKEIKGCKRILITSPKVLTYDLKPQMSAKTITRTLLKEMPKYDVIILNFANGDMVGHTGKMKETIKAVEVLDKCLAKIYKKVMKLKGTLIVTADHGNSDYMLDNKNNSITSHSMSKVPFIITSKNIKLKNGILSDIAPTLLEIINISIPKEMTGKSLIK